MEDFQQFELQEVFRKSDYSKLPNSLRFDKLIKEEGKLIRLLTGTTRIRNNITGEEINQNQNYSILGKRTVTRFAKKLFSEFFSSTADLHAVHEYLKGSNPSNIKLFKDIVNEYCFYFYYTSKSLHTLSFLHVYRILERISYTFPMFYASKETDYIGTFTKLQTFFKGSNSELKFFNLFVNGSFEDEALNYRVKIEITAFNEEIREKYFKTIKHLCQTNDPEIEIKDKNEFSDITIENRNTLNLLVQIRNRYFHFASGGQRNISSSDLMEPNHFFGLLNEHFINWLSVIYFQIVKSSIK